MKLSTAQMTLLYRFKSDKKLIQHRFGADIWFSWEGGFRAKGIRYKTVLKLESCGFIRDTRKSVWEKSKYVITDAGRELLRLETERWRKK